MCMMKSRKTASARMAIGMTDIDVLEKFQRIVGTGHITGPYRGQGKNTPVHYKSMYQWSISRWPEIQRLLSEFVPYLGERRREQGAKLMTDYHSMLRMPQRARKSY